MDNFKAYVANYDPERDGADLDKYIDKYENYNEDEIDANLDSYEEYVDNFKAYVANYDPERDGADLDKYIDKYETIMKMR